MEVTETIFEQYQAIQRAGPCNMTNKNCVQKAAYEREFFELVTFIEDGNYYEDLLMEYETLAQGFGKTR